MKKRIGLIVALVASVVLALTLAAPTDGILYAGGGLGASPRTAFLGSNVELHIALPFAVTPVWSGATFNFDGTATIVYPGQRIAEGVLRIENRSPFDYGASVKAEPQKVLGDTYPYFEVRVWIEDTLFQSPKDIPAGVTVEMRVEVLIPYGAPVSSFQGLDVIVDAVPPPTETIAKCPANGCG